MEERQLKMLDVLLNYLNISVDDEPHSLEELNSAKKLLSALDDAIKDKLNKKINAHPDSLKIKKSDTKELNLTEFNAEIERRAKEKFEKWLIEQRGSTDPKC